MKSSEKEIKNLFVSNALLIERKGADLLFLG